MQGTTLPPIPRGLCRHRIGADALSTERLIDLAGRYLAPGAPVTPVYRLCTIGQVGAELGRRLVRSLAEPKGGR